MKLGENVAHINIEVLGLRSDANITTICKCDELSQCNQRETLTQFICTEAFKC